MSLGVSLVDRCGHRCRCAESPTCRRRTRPNRRTRAPERRQDVPHSLHQGSDSAIKTEGEPPPPPPPRDEQDQEQRDHQGDGQRTNPHERPHHQDHNSERNANRQRPQMGQGRDHEPRDNQGEEAGQQHHAAAASESPRPARPRRHWPPCGGLSISTPPLRENRFGHSASSLCEPGRMSSRTSEPRLR